MNKIEEMYEKRKKDPTYEIDFIEDIQYNFKLSDMVELLKINSKEDLEIFKRYLYYLDVYRVNNCYIESNEDAFKKFKEVIVDDEDKEKLLDLFIRHENLFCDKSGLRRLNLVPKKYDNRIFKY